MEVLLARSVYCALLSAWCKSWIRVWIASQVSSKDVTAAVGTGSGIDQCHRSTSVGSGLVHVVADRDHQVSGHERVPQLVHVTSMSSPRRRAV